MWAVLWRDPEESINESKLIIAVDWRKPEEVNRIVDTIKEWCKGHIDRILIKFNDQLFRLWVDGVLELTDEQEWYILMLDPKLHDIPQTVAHAIEQLAESWLAEKTEYITIHASWWTDMIKAAVESRNKAEIKTKILAVTVLTTLWEKWAQASFDETAKYWVLKLAKIALEAWADWIVCSPLEAPILRAVFWEKYSDFLIVTPWIRFADSKVDHQTRRKTPSWAILWGSSDLVCWSDILVKNQDWTINTAAMIAAIDKFFNEIDGIVYQAEKKKYEFERLLYTGEWLDLLKYIWAIYSRPEWWAYCRLASKLLSDTYINIWASERNYLVLEKAARELAEKLNKTVWLDKVWADKIDEVRWDYVIMWAQMWSVRLSWVLAEKMWIETSIYAEKNNPEKEALDDIKALLGMFTWKLQPTTLLQWVEELTKRKYSDTMLLNRHDIDLTWKKVILSEDIVTEWTTLDRMIELVKQKWWEVIAIACVWNRHWKDNFKWIPMISCVVPPKFGMFWDENTPVEKRIWKEMLPAWSKIAEKPKNVWNELVQSMRDSM